MGFPHTTFVRLPQVLTPYDGEIFDEPDVFFEFRLHVPTEDGAPPTPGEVASPPPFATNHPGVELRANLKSISHRCHLFEVAFAWGLTKETIHLPLGCLQGGSIPTNSPGRILLLIHHFLQDG